MIQPLAKEGQGSPGAAKGLGAVRKDSSLEPSEGTGPIDSLALNCKWMNRLKTLTLWYLATAALGNWGTCT